MKLPWWIPLLAAVLAVLCGCATAPAPVYPRSTPLSMHVSSGTVSTWTETPAEDHLIPDSQVFVSGRGSSAVASLGAVGGLLGSLMGTGINQSRNEAAVAPAQEALRLRFNGELELALKAAIASEPTRASYVVVEGGQQAPVTLLPSVRLTVADDNSARLAFRLTVRFRDAGTGDEVKKEYYYLYRDRKPVAGPEGWAHDGSTAMKLAAREAFAQLARVMLDDMQGRLSNAFEQEPRAMVKYRVAEPADRTVSALVLREYPDQHLAVAPVFGERPSRWLVVVVDRKSLAGSGP